jgi:hypothetical protein
MNLEAEESELTVSGVGSRKNNGKKGIRLCKEDFKCDLNLQ